MELEIKKYIVVPHDAYEILGRRHATLGEACEQAKDACAETGQRMLVVELKAIASRADRPVTLREV